LVVGANWHQARVSILFPASVSIYEPPSPGISLWGGASSTPPGAIFALPARRRKFLSPLEIQVTKDGDVYLVEASQAVAIVNAVAYLSETLHPRSIFLGLSRQNLMRQSFKYFLLGEGEVGLMVYAILQKYWATTPQDDERPCIFLMSD
jgi:hypothetical protein